MGEGEGKEHLLQTIIKDLLDLKREKEPATPRANMNTRDSGIGRSRIMKEFLDQIKDFEFYVYKGNNLFSHLTNVHPVHLVQKSKHFTQWLIGKVSGSRMSGLIYGSFCLTYCGPLVHYVTSPGLSFLICKMGNNMTSSS